MAAMVGIQSRQQQIIDELTQIRDDIQSARISSVDAVNRSNSLIKEINELPHDEHLAQGAYELVRLIGVIVTDRNTTRTFGGTIFRNMCANMPRLITNPTVVGLFEGPSSIVGIPIVCVQPGPSLAKNIDVLAKHQDRAIIATSTHGIAPLQRAGVRIDLVAAVDPQPQIAAHLDGLDLSGVAAFLLPLQVHPSVYNAIGDAPCYTPALFRESDHLLVGGDTRSLVKVGGSVATLLYSFAKHKAQSVTVLVGTDLAHTDGAAYTEGTTAPLAEEASSYAPGYYGGRVQAPTSYNTYRYWMEMQEGELPASERSYNCTEGGAMISGMYQRPLSELLPILPLQSVVECRRRLVQPVLDYRSHQARNRKEIAENTERIRRQCAEAGKLAHAAMEAKPGPSQDRYSKQLAQSVTECQLLQTMCQAELIESQEKRNPRLAWVGIARAAREVVPALAAVVQRVRSTKLASA